MSHTHWDREWYLPVERFRQRLTSLIDELLDRPSDGHTFLLDGQTVVLEDYLEVRPDRAAELSRALTERRLEAGPWFVLADELIPGGEALVRNLLAGQRTLNRMRAMAPPVLYCPDSFGHPSALPTIANGFGRDAIVLWRGLGGKRSPAVDTMRWLAPDGSSALVYHLTSTGYELGANLPADRDEARKRWSEIRGQYGARPNAGLALLLNGADHHARQDRLADALEALTEAARPVDIVRSSLARFIWLLRDVTHRADLPEISGEQRDSYGYTWTLQGTFATRAPQKRRYALAERELVRDVEPWIALGRPNASRRALLDAAWRQLLLCQPHDTLCGCSIDEVARAMTARLESTELQAKGLREDAILDLIDHDRVAARQRREDWKPVAVVRNSAARPRSGVALVEIDALMADVPVGPGSGHVDILDHDPQLAYWPVAPYQPLDAELVESRTESPTAYPDNDAVLRATAAVWVPEVPAYGVSCFDLRSDYVDGLPDGAEVTVKGKTISNGAITVRWNARGAVGLATADGRRIARLYEWESRDDRGDLYTPSIRGAGVRPRLLSTRVVHKGPLIASVEQRWRIARGKRYIDATVRVMLERGAPFVRIGVLGTNAATDHRLRIVFHTDVSRGDVVADAAYGPVERQGSPRANRTERRMETPQPTAPLHRYVSLYGRRSGATIFSDGLREYEADRNRIAVTLLRSVGELSRSDLPERPGHAGWPAPTPEAQCIGPFEAEFALLLHGPREPRTTDLVERTSDDVLHPLSGVTLRSSLAIPDPVPGVELRGEGIAFSALKPAESGAWIVARCVNLLDWPTSGAWKFPGAIADARLSRLDETEFDRIAFIGDTIALDLAPREVRTILVRLAR